MCPSVTIKIMNCLIKKVKFTNKFFSVYRKINPGLISTVQYLPNIKQRALTKKNLRFIIMRSPHTRAEINRPSPRRDPPIHITTKIYTCSERAAHASASQKKQISRSTRRQPAPRGFIMFRRRGRVRARWVKVGSCREARSGRSIDI